MNFFEVINLNINFQLLTVFLSTFLIFILGFLVYFHEPKKSISKVFLVLAIITSFWGFFNYLYTQPNLGNLALIFLRIHMFFSVWYAFTIFLFFELLKQGIEKTGFILTKQIQTSFLAGVLISVLTLTPLVFEKITKFSEKNTILDVKTNIGIVFFGILVIYLLISSIIAFFKSVNKNLLIFIGFIASFILHIILNFIFPNVFKNINYVGWGSVFTFPFILSAGYAIIKQHFLNVRLITTNIFIIVLLFLTVFEIFNSVNLIDVIIKFIIFILLLIFSSRLIQSVIIEVEQKERLEQLNRIKSEFLSFASHQIKAPMAVTKGYAELIIEGIENVPEQAKDFAKKIKEAVDNLLVLIEEFMDYRRIEEGKLELHFEEVEIISLIKEIVNNLNLLAKQKNLELSFETNLEQMIIKVDKVRFSQVIQNLIDNAIKYTPQGWVKVKVYKDNSNLMIEVSDSGIGMSKELQSKLFGEFVRDPSIKKEIRGTGLGLYIAKNIIEAHNGKIWTESEGEGRGSKFYVKVPI